MRPCPSRSIICCIPMWEWLCLGPANVQMPGKENFSWAWLIHSGKAPEFSFHPSCTNNLNFASEGFNCWRGCLLLACWFSSQCPPSGCWLFPSFLHLTILSICFPVGNEGNVQLRWLMNINYYIYNYPSLQKVFLLLGNSEKKADQWG